MQYKFLDSLVVIGFSVVMLLAGVHGISAITKTHEANVATHVQTSVAQATNDETQQYVATR